MIRRPPPPGGSANTAVFRRSFIERAHRLIWLGYGRMRPSDFATAPEPAITGALVQAITEIFDDPGSEPRVDFFEVHDDPPVSDGVRTGKSRRRLDVKIVSSERRPRQRLAFEAKRLHEKRSITAYLGRDGLGRFLRGEYAREEDEGGMLGHVQSGEPDAWAGDLAVALPQSGRGASRDPAWRRWSVTGGPDHCYLSRHRRPPIGRDLDIYHTLLRFH